MILKDKERIGIVDKYFQTKNASGNKFDTSSVAKFLRVARRFDTQYFWYLFSKKSINIMFINRNIRNRTIH